MDFLNLGSLNSGLIPFRNKQKEQNQNFFVNTAPGFTVLPQDTFEKSYVSFKGYSKPLYGTDSDLLKSSLYQHIPSDSLRLELQIENAKVSGDKIKNEVKFAGLLGLNSLQKLKNQEKQHEVYFSGLKQKYREIGTLFYLVDKVSEILENISTKISGSINNTKNYFRENIIYKIPMLKKRAESKQLLEKANLINEAAKNIFNKKNSKDFQTLTALMLQANFYGKKTEKFLALTTSVKS